VIDNYTAASAAHTLEPENTVEHAIDLLDRALTILDSENLLIAAAKVDDARNSLRCATGRVASFPPS